MATEKKDEEINFENIVPPEKMEEMFGSNRPWGKKDGIFYINSDYFAEKLIDLCDGHLRPDLLKDAIPYAFSHIRKEAEDSKRKKNHEPSYTLWDSIFDKHIDPKYRKPPTL